MARKNATDPDSGNFWPRFRETFVRPHLPPDQERDRLAGRVEELEILIGDLRDCQRDIVDRLDVRTLGTLDEMETVIAATGLNLDQLLAQVTGPGGGQGGSFIAPDQILATDVAYELQVSVALLDQRLDRWDALQQLAQALPLRKPLDNYRLTSEFGYRRDPVNDRRSFHNGVDMATSHRAPLLAAGSGQVTFAGWRGGYGRVVEIDHGYGLESRAIPTSRRSP